MDLHTSGRKDTGWSWRATGIIKFKYRHGRRRRTEGEGQRREPKEKTRGSKRETRTDGGGEEELEQSPDSLARWQKLQMKEKDYPTPRQVMKTICGSHEGGGASGVNASSRWAEGEESRREEELKVRGTHRGTGWGSGESVSPCSREQGRKKKKPKINETQPN